MQNGKSCITDQISTRVGFGSTEFHVIREKDNSPVKIYMPYIWALLSNDDILDIAQAVFNGSAGQQRVSDTFLKNFPAILPSYEQQVEIATELFDKRDKLLEARKKAEQDWQKAKRHFEETLIGE